MDVDEDVEAHGKMQYCTFGNSESDIFKRKSYQFAGSSMNGDMRMNYELEEEKKESGIFDDMHCSLDDSEFSESKKSEQTDLKKPLRP